MKVSTMPGLLLGFVAGLPTAQAAIYADTSTGILDRQEKCASALNSYLSYRYAHTTGDNYKIQKLENQVDALCEGYRIRLVDNNGVMTGVIELAE